MSTKYDRNFTNFQNVSVSGSGTSTPPQNVGMIEMKQGATQLASTISISNIPGGIAGSVNGTNEHPYFHVSNAGLSAGTGFIRLTNVGSSPYTTIRARTATYLDTDVALSLPAKSGLIGISGTFTVMVPALAADAISQTTVVISGIRAEDGFLANFMSGAYETAITTNRGVLHLAAARPTNTGVELIVTNPTTTATGYSTVIGAYTAFR